MGAERADFFVLPVVALIGPKLLALREMLGGKGTPQESTYSNREESRALKGRNNHHSSHDAETVRDGGYFVPSISGLWHKMTGRSLVTYGIRPGPNPAFSPRFSRRAEGQEGPAARVRDELVVVGRCFQLHYFVVLDRSARYKQEYQTAISAKTMINGFIETFQPDYVVETRDGQIREYGVNFPQKRSTFFTELLARDEQDRCQIGVDLRSICHDMYVEQFQFV